MWDRKALKRQARASLKRNYWAAIIVCFLVCFVAGEFTESMDFIHRNADSVTNGALLMAVGGVAGESPPPGDTAGLVLAILFDAATTSQDWLFRMLAGGLFLLAALVMLTFRFLVGGPLRVGARRFFLRNQTEKADFGELFAPIREKRWLHTVWVMFCRDAFVWALYLLVIPGIIADYTYRMVPYLLAERSDLSRKEVFLLSKQMMKGNRWRMFLFDLTLIPWRILSCFTLGLSGIFWANSYILSAEAQAYMALRAALPENAFPVRLEAVPAFQPMGREIVLPSLPKFPIREKYPLPDYILFFFTFSGIGWIWEVGFHLVQTGQLVNRGTMLGPWLPIYGTGGVLVLLLLRKWFHRPGLTFLLSTVLCTAIEYATSWVLEAATGLRWWDYSGYFLNLNGRVCLEGALVFGVGCCAAIYLIAPMLGQWYDRIPPKTAGAVCVVLLTLFAADGVRSVVDPNTGEGVTGSAAPRKETAIHQTL